MHSQKIITGLLIICAFVFLGFRHLQDCEPIDRKQMRDMLIQLGYTVKDLETDPGKAKYSIVITRDALDIPIATEISPNGKFIWLTVNLGDGKPENGNVNFSLLKQNAIIQPCQFYVTEKGRLMMGLPVENRGVNNAMLRERLESIASKVGDTKATWQQ